MREYEERRARVQPPYDLSSCGQLANGFLGKWIKKRKSKRERVKEKERERRGGGGAQKKGSAGMILAYICSVLRDSSLANARARVRPRRNASQRDAGVPHPLRDTLEGERKNKNKKERENADS